MLFARRTLITLAIERALVRYRECITRLRFACWTKLVIEQALITRFPPHPRMSVPRQLQLDEALRLPNVQPSLPVVVDVARVVNVIRDYLLLCVGIGVVTNETVVEI